MLKRSKLRLFGLLAAMLKACISSKGQKGVTKEEGDEKVETTAQVSDLK